MMKRVASVLALSLLAAAGTQAQVLMKPSDQFQASMDLAVALRAKDAAKTMALLAPNSVIMPPGRPLLGGHMEVEEALKALFAAGQVRLAIASIGSGESGGWGYDSGTYELTITPEKGKAVKERGKYTTLLVKNESSKWVVSQIMWNTDAPPSAP